MDVFRIGLIGAGSIGTRHIKAIDEVAHIELVAVADPSPAATALGDARALRDRAHVLKMGRRKDQHVCIWGSS